MEANTPAPATRSRGIESSDTANAWSVAHHGHQRFTRDDYREAPTMRPLRMPPDLDPVYQQSGSINNAINFVATAN